MLLHLVLITTLTAGANDVSTLLQHGLQAMGRGELVTARQDLEQASQLDPRNAFVWAALAELYLRIQQPALAVSAARIAETQGGNIPVVCHALAIYYSDAKQFGAAARLEAIYAASPQADSGAANRAAQWYLADGELPAALPLAKQAAMQNSEAAFEWAQLLLRKREFTQAADLIDTALGIFPDNAQLKLALGVARYGQRRFDDAISAFLEVIKVEPTVEQPYVFLGRMLDQAGPHLSEIKADDERWAAANPGNARAQLELAKVLGTADSQSPRTEPLLQRSVKLDPGNWEAHYELGVLLETRRRYAEAAEELKRAAELNPKQPTPHYHLARVYDRLGDRERAAAERSVHASLTK